MHAFYLPILVMAGYSVGRGAPVPSHLEAQSTIPGMDAYGYRLSGVERVSGYRTGSSTFHGKAQATDWRPVGAGWRDLTGGYNDTGLRRLFDHFAQVGSALQELILSNAPYWIISGRRMTPTATRSYQRLHDTHLDHLHVATTVKDLGAGQLIGPDQEFGVDPDPLDGIGSPICGRLADAHREVQP